MPDPTLKEIDLNQFSAIFQILLAFYLGNAISGKFNHFFSIESNFKKFIDSSYVLVKQKVEVENLNSALGGVDLLQEQLQKNKLKKRKINVDISHARVNILYDKYIEPKVYANHEHNTNSNLHNCLKPFYLFFGIYTLCLLILSGFMKSWERGINLSNLNLVAFIALLFLLCRMYVISSYCKYWGCIRAFIISIILFIIIFLPAKVFAKHSVVGDSVFDKTLNIDGHDFQIILALFLALSIFIIHISMIIYISVEIYWLKYRLKKAYGIEIIPQIYQAIIESQRPQQRSGDIGVLR